MELEEQQTMPHCNLFMLYLSKYQKVFKSSTWEECHFSWYFLSTPKSAENLETFSINFSKKCKVHVIHQIHVLRQITENITTYLSMLANKHMPCTDAAMRSSQPESVT